jgi:hypothetical protein
VAVVVDANLLVAFAADDSRAPLVISLIQRWTFDGPLARNAASIGYPVHLIE